MTTDTDQLLIQQCLDGDTAAFSEIVERYQNFAYTIALRMLRHKEEAEEVAQDSFIKAFDSLDSFRGESRFSTWLYRIVYHKSLDRIKKNHRQQSFELIEEITDNRVDQIENGLEVLLSAERKQIIKNCIEKLGQTEAVVVSLFYFEEQTVKEISVITGLTEENVKVKLYRSRKKLFSLLKYYIEPVKVEQDERAV